MIKIKLKNSGVREIDSLEFAKTILPVGSFEVLQESGEKKPVKVEDKKEPAEPKSKKQKVQECLANGETDIEAIAKKCGCKPNYVNFCKQ